MFFHYIFLLEKLKDKDKNLILKYICQQKLHFKFHAEVENLKKLRFIIFKLNASDTLDLPCFTLQQHKEIFQIHARIDQFLVSLTFF